MYKFVVNEEKITAQSEKIVVDLEFGDHVSMLFSFSLALIVAALPHKRLLTYFGVLHSRIEIRAISDFSLASTDADDDDDVEKFIYFSVVRSRGRNLSMSGMSWDNLFLLCDTKSYFILNNSRNCLSIKMSNAQIDSIETWT